MEKANPDHPLWEKDLLNRFLRYVQVDTPSDRHGEKKPSTAEQMDLLALLDQELGEYGLEDRTLFPQGFLLARLPPSKGLEAIPSLLFLAHVDVSTDAPPRGVTPQVHLYQGGILNIGNGQVLDPEEEPLLGSYEGQQIITSDGSTLLGADDKAGVAEIMTVVQILSSPGAPDHGPLELMFTTDEEVGRGMEGVPLEQIRSQAAFTLDGGEEGALEVECYNAWGARVQFFGRSIHPGAARGKLVNAISMASSFLQGLPRSESPEATDGRYGNLWPHEIHGSIEKAELEILIRDFEVEEGHRRISLLESLARTIELAFPGGKVQLEVSPQYTNMFEKISAHPRLLAVLKESARAIGLEPRIHPIRGGTDGSRLTELGIPTPNIFAGGINFHSRKEWVALKAMCSSVNLVLKILEFWCKE